MKWNLSPTKAFKSKKLKWVGLFGLVLSALSLFTHFLLARYSDGFAVSEYTSTVTIFSWRPRVENADLSSDTASSRRLWGPIRLLESIHPFANPRRNYVAPPSKTNGFIFIRIRGGFHEIRNSICDVVVIARLLNATLVIPEVQSTTNSKGIRVGDEALISIGQGCSLQHLNVSGCHQIGDAEIIAIAKGSPQLTYLDVSVLQSIGDRSMMELGNSCPLLREVVMSHCRKVTDIGLEYLAKKCANLESCHMVYCPRISASGVATMVTSCVRMKKILVEKFKVSARTKRRAGPIINYLCVDL